MAREGRGAAAEIVFDHVWHRYPGRAVPAIQDLSLTIPAGEICVLIGPSGGGKTTALKMVNRLIPSAKGTSRFYRAITLYLWLAEDTEPREVRHQRTEEEGQYA